MNKMNGIKLKKVSSATLWVWGVIMDSILLIAEIYIIEPLDLSKTEELIVSCIMFLEVAFLTFWLGYQIFLQIKNAKDGRMTDIEYI